MENQNPVFETQQPTKPTTFCGKCGSALAEGQTVCPSCGTPIQAAPQVAQPAPATFAPTVTPKKKNKTPLIIGIVGGVVAIAVAVVIVVLSLGGNSGPDFESIYDQYCVSTWAKVGSDGSYLRIDTNPSDEEDAGVVYSAAYYAIESVNEALGLPESLFEEISETTSLMGKQSQTFEDVGITVSWSYHPDNGCEVTYKKIS